MRCVGDGFLFAHLAAAGIEIGHAHAEIHSRDLKRAASAGGGLFKQQDDVLALHGGGADVGAALGLQVVAQVQQIADFLRGKVLQSQKAPAF